jgi:hypothetical protein
MDCDAAVSGVPSWQRLVKSTSNAIDTTTSTDIFAKFYWKAGLFSLILCVYINTNQRMLCSSNIQLTVLQTTAEKHKLYGVCTRFYKQKNFTFTFFSPSSADSECLVPLTTWNKANWQTQFVCSAGALRSHCNQPLAPLTVARHR